MQVSIVIPAYNAERYLAQTLESVLAQTLADWELIVMDDGSRDGTGGIADAYAARDGRIRVVRQPNQGLSNTRNLGLREASAAYVIFLDADDLWEPDTLSALSSALDARPDCVGAYALARFIDGEGRPCQPGVLEAWQRDRREVTGRGTALLKPEEPTSFAALALRQRIATAGTVLLRRSVLEDVGPFDASLKGCEDWDMWLRLARRGGFVFVDRLLFHYRQSGGGLSADKRALHQTERDVRRKHQSSPENTPEQKRTLRAGFRLRERESYQERMQQAWQGVRRGEVVSAARVFAYAQANLVRSLRGRP